MLERIEGAIKNGQFRNTDKTGHTRHRKKTVIYKTLRRN